MTEPAIFANIFIKKMIVSETIFIEFPRIFTTFHPRKGIEWCEHVCNSANAIKGDEPPLQGIKKRNKGAMKHRKPTSAWQMLGLKISKKVVVGITAAATALGGLAIASTAAQANTGRDSYADTVQNVTFEQARKKYGLAKEMVK